MSEQQLAFSVFREVNSDESNRKCFECGQANPNWVSVNNGVLLCINCSGLHRGLGVQISYVLSISLDLWTER
jgi:ADP-ribosylation factor GTPase-activating protein 1